MTPKFILASGSSRRRELLNQLGFAYQVVPVNVDENLSAGERPADYVLRIAMKKAHWAAGSHGVDLPVLAADTAVVLEGDILGKPLDQAHATEILARLSGRTHEVFSAVFLLSPGGEQAHRLSVSRVTFAPLSPEWIAAYCATGEPLDKAGAYAIQGLAAQCITRVEGSYSGVMGLPLFETVELLGGAGIPTLPGLT